MKYALLGTDPESLQLARAAVELGHSIVWVGDVRPTDATAIAEVAPHVADRSDEWELVLDGSNADAVIVGRGAATTELRAEQLKRLAAEAIPLLVVQPVCESVLPYYEVDMTRRETGGVVRHYNPMAGHPIVGEVARWISESHPELGTIHQLTCERRTQDDSRLGTLGHLARDVELIAAVAGAVRRVTAVGPQPSEPSYASLQIQMSTHAAAAVRWSVRSSRNVRSRLDMTFIGERGTATLRVDEELADGRPATWEMEIDSGEGPERSSLETYDAAHSAIRELTVAVAENDSEKRAAASTWEDATRAMEVVDAVELSLEKGRTVDVFQQQLTERLAFRGTMAALGCGLLLIGFFALVLITMLGGAEGALGRPLLSGWPLVLLAVLAFFLLLQMVPLLAQKSRRSASQATRLEDAREEPYDTERADGSR